MNIQPVRIGDKLVGPGHPTFIVGEIGVNHNGDLAIAKALIDLAVKNRLDAVKFQKRTVEDVYTPEELAQPRESPFGRTNRDLKYGLEFGEDQYAEIDRYCKAAGIIWFGSPWDVKSVDFLDRFNTPCYKVASACLTDQTLLKHIRSKGKPVILSTGMSTQEEIDAAVALLEGVPLVLLHCTSTYPCADEEINLALIDTLRRRFQRPIGYSGHEVGLMPTVMAVVGFGACMVERHITLNRAMWGTDQSASLELRGVELLSKYIRVWPVVRGDGRKRVYDSEIAVKNKLRRFR
jgi:N-acetylneuraminate synthase